MSGGDLSFELFKDANGDDQVLVFVEDMNISAFNEPGTTGSASLENLVRRCLDQSVRLCWQVRPRLGAIAGELSVTSDVQLEMNTFGEAISQAGAFGTIEVDQIPDPFYRLTVSNLKINLGDNVSIEGDFSLNDVVIDGTSSNIIVGNNVVSLVGTDFDAELDNPIQNATGLYLTNGTAFFLAEKQRLRR